MQFIDEPLRLLDKGAYSAQAALILFPISGVQVFDHVDTVLAHAGIEEFERGRDVAHHMAAVIQNDIRRSKFIDDLPEKLQIALIADPNRNLILFHHFTGGIDVNTDNLSEGA